MNTLIKTLLVVFGMITTTTGLFGQTATTGSVTLSGDIELINGSRSVVKNPIGDFAVSTMQLNYNATVNLFQDDGTLVSSATLENFNLGTEGTPTYVSSKVFAIAYEDNVYVAGLIRHNYPGGNTAIYRLDTVTNSLVHLTAFENSQVTAMHEYNGYLYVALALSATSKLGSGYFGDIGPSLVNYDGSFPGVVQEAVLLKFDPFGTLIGNPVHFKTSNNCTVEEIKHDVSGNILIDLHESLSGVDEYSYHVLDGTNLADTDQIPNTIMQTDIHPVLIDMVEDSSEGVYILSCGSLIQKINKTSGAVMSENSGFSANRLFIDGNTLVLAPNATATVVNKMGKNHLEGRHAKQNVDVAGDEVHILSSENDTSVAFRIAANTPGVSTSIDFLEIVHDFAPPAVSTNVVAGVVETFDYVEPNDMDPLLMDSSDNHIGYMQFADATTYTSVGIGNEVPNSWYNIPAGYAPMLANALLNQDLITGEYYFDVRLYLATPGRLLYYRVYCTTDDVYQPEPNFAPVPGTNAVINAMVNDDATGAIDVTDPNAGDVLTYTAVGLPDGITIDPITGQYLGTYQTAGNVTATVTATDQGGLFVDITVYFDIAPASNVGIDENELTALSIYPNPVQGLATIELSRALSNASVIVTDMSGKTYSVTELSSGTLKHTIDASNLPSGIYLVNITDNNVIVRSKFVKQ